MAVANDELSLAVHYKNLAVTYALKGKIEETIEYVEKGIRQDIGGY